MKSKTLLFEVPHSNQTYDVRVFEDGSFRAYLIVHNDEVHLNVYIDSYDMLPTSIRSSVEAFVKTASAEYQQEQMQQQQLHSAVHLKKAS